MIDRLQTMCRDDLIKIARQKGIPVDDEMTNDMLVEWILEALEEDRQDTQTIIDDAAIINEKKFELSDPIGLENPISGDYNVPVTYNETFIMFMPRDPEWAYAYWELKDSLLNDLRDEKVDNLVLRVQGSAISLGQDETDSYDIPVKLQDKSWYINLPQKGWKYYIELMMINGSHQTMITRSNTIYPPRAVVAESGNKMTLDATDELIGLSGLTRIGESAYDKMIPQRIISMMKDKYIQNG